MQKGFAPVLVLLIVAVLLAVGVYYLYSQDFKNWSDIQWFIKNEENLKDSQPTSSQISSSSPTISTQPLEDETANWKIYTSQNLKISFSYPDNWIIKPMQIDSPYYHGVITLDSENQKSNGPSPASIGVSYWDNPDGLSLQQLDQKYAGAQGSPGIYSSQKSQKVVGPDGPASYQADANCEPVLCDKFLIPYKDKVYQLTSYYTSPNDSNRESQKEILNRILQSFKFLQ